MNEVRKIDTRESVRVVTSNNFLKATGLENASLKARKLLYLAMAQCKQDDKQFFTYSIKATEFAEFMGIDPSNVYDEADKITDELMHGFIKFVPEEKKKFKKFQLFKTCEYTEDAEIKFCLSREMTPIVLELKKDFSQPLLNDFAKMRSNYSIEIWHLMQREMQSKKPYGSKEIEFELSLEELRTVTGTQDKFTQLVHFKTKVLDKAIREIRDNCGVVITYENLKKSRTVTGFRFKAVSQFYIEPSKRPNRVRKMTQEEEMEYNEAVKNAKQLTLEELLD